MVAGEPVLSEADVLRISREGSSAAAKRRRSEARNRTCSPQSSKANTPGSAHTHLLRDLDFFPIRRFIPKDE